jgi:hypothetical protein
MSGEGVVKGARRKKGDGSERPGGKEGIDSKKNKSDSKKLNERDQALFDSVNQHPLHVHDILTHTGQQIPAGPVVVPRGGKALKGGVKIPSEIEDHLLLEKVVEENS